MDISTVKGLPAHPLLIHIPVMGIPLCALLVLLCVARPHWRRSLTIPLGLASLVTMFGTFLAAGSGEKLEAMLPPEDRQSALLHHHTELGDQTKIIALVFGAITLAYLAAGWYRDRQTSEPANAPAGTGLTNGIVALGLLALLVGGIATVWDVRTGHAGAKSAWGDVVASAPQDSGADAGDGAPVPTDTAGDGS